MPTAVSQENHGIGLYLGFVAKIKNKRMYEGKNILYYIYTRIYYKKKYQCEKFLESEFTSHNSRQDKKIFVHFLLWSFILD